MDDLFGPVTERYVGVIAERDQLKLDLENASAAIAAKDASLAKMKAKLETRDNEIAMLKKELAARKSLNDGDFVRVQVPEGAHGADYISISWHATENGKGDEDNATGKGKPRGAGKKKELPGASQD